MSKNIYIYTPALCGNFKSLEFNFLALSQNRNIFNLQTYLAIQCIWRQAELADWLIQGKVTMICLICQL